MFNTSLTGYQEIMTDPSYAGQMVCFTCVHLGNTGVNAADAESSRPWLDAIVCRSVSQLVSNHRSEECLQTFCERSGVVGMEEVDTRALTRRLRDSGAMPAVVCTDGSVPDSELLQLARGWTLDGKDTVSLVSTKEAYNWAAPTDAEWAFGGAAAPSSPFKVIAYDFGIKRNILRRLAAHGCSVTVMPAATPASAVLALSPDGVFLSNGPGDPSALPYAVQACRELLAARVPLFGICMGHQVLAQALGGETYKMKFGHHSGNHPIRREADGRVEISAQNHNYAVRAGSLPAGVRVTHTSLNDGSVAGLAWAEKRCLGIQYHPEAAPGPHDSDDNFLPFLDLMAAARAEKGVCVCDAGGGGGASL